MKKTCGTRARMQDEDCIVLGEASILIIRSDLDIQLQDLPQQNSPTPSNKVDKKGEID